MVSLSEKMKIKDIIEPNAFSAIEELNKHYSSLSTALYSPPALQLMNQLEEQNRLLTSQLEPFTSVAQTLSLSFEPKLQAFQEIGKGFDALSKQFLEFQSPLQEALEQIHRQISPFQETMQQFREVQKSIDFSYINDLLNSITEALRTIPREYIVKLRLHSEYWLITDDALLLQIEERDAIDDQDALTNHIVNYYKINNWQRLENTIQSWADTVHVDRMAIFESAVLHVKLSESEDVHLLTVPALIAQIDGLVRDLYSTLPRSIKKRIEKEIKDNLPEDMKARRLDTRPDEVIGSIVELVDYWSAEIFQSAIYEGLFRNSNQINIEETYSLYRHKVMHGDKDFLKYGNEENFVRLVLYADFIISLIGKVKTGDIVIEEAA